ncbi:hypothetical protein [Methylobacterium ajmalii]|uniref:hypothetical protein n=1 Tax=Methylobacterium ajmalii TaxID=2738439 RepID=UPI002F34FAA4
MAAPEKLHGYKDRVVADNVLHVLRGIAPVFFIRTEPDERRGGEMHWIYGSRELVRLMTVAACTFPSDSGAAAFEALREVRRRQDDE